MAAAVMGIIILISLGVAVASRRGVVQNSMSDVMVASRSFGAILLFIVAVGETYSVGTMIGVPGAVYGKGASYAVWFVGYMCLGFCLGYFINPMIWRLGRLSHGVTIAEAFRWRFNSRPLECLIAVMSIIFLMPWIQIQFAGLGIILKYIGVNIDYVTGVLVATVVAYLYVAIAGIRAPAWVSIMKDFLLLFAMVVGGLVVAAKHPGGVAGIFSEVAQVAPDKLIVETTPITKNVTFMLSTMIFQTMGLCMFPLTFQFIFTGKSEDTVRRNQIFMPLYMYMYPFLILTAYYVLATVPGLPKADEAFMALIQNELPPWAVGLVAGGGVLTCILVAALCALSIGGFLVQNVISQFVTLKSSVAVGITRIATGSALLLSAIMAIYLPSLMLSINNFAYFGFTQMFTLTVAAAFWSRATKQGAFAGLLVGLVMIFWQVGLGVNIGDLNLNKGLIALICNAIALVVVSLATQPDEVTKKNYQTFANYNPAVEA